MTLKSQIETDCSSAGCFFNTDEFAETATYFPVCGPSRSVLLVIDSQASYPEQNAGLASQQTLEVFVSKDATSGIPSPTLGDGLRLPGDATGEGWSFVEIAEADQHAHVLRFQRMRLEHAGGTRQAR